MSNFLVPIGVVLSPSDPPGQREGEVYYNTTQNALRFFNGTEWKNVYSPNVHVGQEDPGFTEPGLWIETDENEDIVTFWIETGGA